MLAKTHTHQHKRRSWGHTKLDDGEDCQNNSLHALCRNKLSALAAMFEHLFAAVTTGFHFNAINIPKRYTIADMTARCNENNAHLFRCPSSVKIQKRNFRAHITVVSAEQTQHQLLITMTTYNILYTAVMIWWGKKKKAREKLACLGAKRMKRLLAQADEQENKKDLIS